MAGTDDARFNSCRVRTTFDAMSDGLVADAAGRGGNRFTRHGGVDTARRYDGWAFSATAPLCSGSAPVIGACVRLKFEVRAQAVDKPPKIAAMIVPCGVEATTQLNEGSFERRSIETLTTAVAWMGLGVGAGVGPAALISCSRVSGAVDSTQHISGAGDRAWSGAVWKNS